MARKKSFCEAEVLEKALQLFHKEGYEGVSVQDLVEKLGISRSSLYETYGSKDALFERVLRTYRKEASGSILNMLKDPPDAYDAIEEFFRHTIGMACSDEERKGCLLVNSILEASQETTSFASQIIRENQDEITEALIQVIELGQDQGTIKKDLDPRATAAMLLALHTGLITRTRIEMNPLIVNQAIDVGLAVLR